MNGAIFPVTVTAKTLLSKPSTCTAISFHRAVYDPSCFPTRTLTARRSAVASQVNSCEETLRAWRRKPVHHPDPRGRRIPALEKRAAPANLLASPLCFALAADREIQQTTHNYMAPELFPGSALMKVFIFANDVGFVRAKHIMVCLSPSMRPLFHTAEIGIDRDWEAPAYQSQYYKVSFNDKRPPRFQSQSGWKHTSAIRQ